MTNYSHEISKSDLRKTSWREQDESDLAEGHIRLRVDAFALTANNVTYAVFGGAPTYYWNFYPSAEPDMGRVPVWGFATIVDSNVSEIETGRRVYGYLPISDSFEVLAARLTPEGFIDGAAHRAELAPIYNTYVFTDADPSYSRDFEAQQMLFRPLYLTGWMICDYLCEGEPKPNTVVISSASSKTALATAHALQARGIQTIGLTSHGNMAFVEESGLYNKTCLYDEVGTLTPEAATAYVDFAGRPALTRAVHEIWGEALKRSMVIGMTDWEADKTPAENLPGPQPEFFFVPTYVIKRAKDFPKGELEKQVMSDLVRFYPVSKRFVTPESIKGRDAIAKAWLDTVDGSIAPTRGLICSF